MDQGMHIEHFLSSFTARSGGVGTFGKYLIRKVVGSKSHFCQKTQKYMGTFGLTVLYILGGGPMKMYMFNR